MITNRRFWVGNIALWILGSKLLSSLQSISKIDSEPNSIATNNDLMQNKLGIFSLSLNVKDIRVSKDFYEKLGFEVFAGSLTQHYLIMKSGETIIGLFQGMFEKNIMTFNPGWDSKAQPLESFDDIRTLQQRFKSEGIKIQKEIPSDTSGPASFTINDPDGNQILFDQHL